MARLVNISDVCNEIFAGGDAPKNNMFVEKTDKFSIPIYSNGEAENGLYGYTNFARVTKPSVTISARGTIGFAAIRNEPFVPIVRLITLTPNLALIDIRYLYYAIQNYHFDGSGTSIPQLTVPMLKQYSFPLPEMEKQIYISTVLDKVNSLISLRKQQLAKLDELVKARFVEMFGGIEETVPLSHYISALLAGKSLAGEEECANKVLKTGAATYDEFDPSQVKNLPADYIPQTDHLLRTGDVIISRMNTAELVGAAAYVWEAPINTYLPDRLWRAELKNNVCPIFVWQSLIQATTKESIRKIASGTSGSMKNISKPGLLRIHVKKVGFDIQEKFSDFVVQVHRQKLTIQQSLDKLEVLKKSLMQEYFG